LIGSFEGRVIVSDVLLGKLVFDYKSKLSFRGFFHVVGSFVAGVKWLSVMPADPQAD
jgi:uncharacterized membrane protein